MSTYGGHCRHCDNLCQKWSDDLAEYEVEFAHYDGTGYWWHDGDCPACAEAKRIAAIVRREGEDCLVKDEWRMLRDLAERIESSEL